jgi:hypothetical protein
MTPSIARVARARIASEASALLDQLDQLAELDGTLTAIEDSFAMHYRTASTILPQVVSHSDALAKSAKGLEQANVVLRSAQAIVAAFPEDKTAGRVVADANTMVARFTRHVEVARNVIRTLAQKQVPPDLKAAAAKVKAALSKRLFDPDVLQVIPWVRSTKAQLPGHSYSWIDTVEFQYKFRIEGLPERLGRQGRFEVELREMALGNRGVQFYDGMNAHPYTSPAQVIEFFDRALQGWDGIVGQAAANVGRAQVADKVKAALESALRRAPSSWGTDAVEVQGLHVSGAYRSGLPKEGEREVGEYRYSEMLAEEIADWRRVLDPLLAPHMAGIASVRVGGGEKSWIYTRITLK